MSDTQALIALLARPGVHSGTELGEQLGVSRVAIKKRIDRLIAEGFPVEAVANRGYCLDSGVELLDATAIRSQVREAGAADVQLDVFPSLDSTNAYLASRTIEPGRMHAVLTEAQPAGQGRRGRTWVASPYRNLMLSLAFSYPGWPANPPGISLAFSVAVHSALEALGVGEVALKWPNDLVARGAKLGGLLVTASGEAGGQLQVVLGVGINLDLAPELRATLDQPVIDLTQLGHAGLSRNRLAAGIIANTAEMLELYPETGFAPFAEYWNQRALYRSTAVRVFDGKMEYCGTLLGVDELGYLQVQGPGAEVRRFNNTELSLRPLEASR